MRLEPIIEYLESRGLDLSATTTAQQYNALVDEPYRLGEFGRDATLVLVIGNTKALWPFITSVWNEDRYRKNPVDTYTDEVIAGAVSEIDTAYDIRLYHEPPPRRIALQRLADVAGLAWLSESHLCVHPTVGPWMALRGAIVFDAEGAPSTPASAPCECTTGCGSKLSEALAAGSLETPADLADSWRTWLEVRQACTVGQTHQYSEQQILYHYTEERHEA